MSHDVATWERAPLGGGLAAGPYTPLLRRVSVCTHSNRTKPMDQVEAGSLVIFASHMSTPPPLMKPAVLSSVGIGAIQGLGDAHGRKKI